MNLFFDLLPWILPPLLGAIIGYVTNYVAIRMLFRPLAEWRFLGLRVPLTPGIIPKNRYVLSENIGKMVSEQLITPDAMQEQLSSVGFREGISNNLSSLTSQLLDTPLSSLKREKLGVFYDTIESFLAEMLGRFMGSKNFIVTVRELLARIVRSLGDKTLGDVLDPHRVRGFLESRLLPKLAQSDSRQKIKSGVKGWVDRQLDQNTPLHTLVPEETVDVVTGAFRSLIPSMSVSALKWLRSDATRRQLETRGRLLLKEILDKLNSFQKFFVSVGQYDRSLEEKMPEIIDDVLAQLERSLADPENQQGIVKAVEEGLEGWRQKGLFDLTYSAGIDLAGKAEELLDRALDSLGDGKGREWLLGALEKFLEKNSKRQIRSLIGSYLGLQENDIVEYAAAPILTYLSKPETAAGLSKQVVSLLTSFFSNREDSTVGKVLGIDEEKKERLDAFVLAKLLAVIEERLPHLVESFNVRDLVVDKINNFDVARVEKLLLIVIAKHLKWINIFGAVLGAFIGFIQVIINLFRF
jgi:uncharacterized membrane protein YheB (UPF0754 family)